MEMQLGCCCETDALVTIRAYNCADGEYVWETENFLLAAISGNCTLWGYRYRETTGEDATKTITNLVSSESYGAPSFPSFTAYPAKQSPSAYNRYQLFKADLITVEPNGDETIQVHDILYEGVVSQLTDPRTDYIFETETGFRGYGYSTFGKQRNNATEEGLIYDRTNPRAAVFRATDWLLLVKNHTIYVSPGAFPVKAGQTWAFKGKDGTVVEMPFRATAAEVETALMQFPFMVSVTATGGPLLAAGMQIDFEFADEADQIVGICWCYRGNSYAPDTQPSAFTIFDMKTFQPVRVPIEPVPNISFLQGGGSNQTAFSPNGSLISIGYNSTTSRYGLYSLSLARSTDGTGLQIATPSGEWVNVLSSSTPYAKDGNDINGVAWHGGTPNLTAAKNGKIAVTTWAKEDPPGTYLTHQIYTTGGSSVVNGFSEMLCGTTVLFSETGDHYRTGTHNTINGTSNYYTNAGYVEAFGEGNTLRESDTQGVGGVGSLLIGASAGKPVSGAMYATPLAYRSTGAGPWIGYGFYSFSTFTNIGYGGAANHALDRYQMLSPGTRWSESTEWRLHLKSGIASPTSYVKSTSWFSYYEPIANVNTELLDWFGMFAASPPTAVCSTSPFGVASKSLGASPSFPTFLEMDEIWVHRGSSSLDPNLAPISANQLVFEWRNNDPVTVHAVSGRNRNQGIIQWTRDVGSAYRGTGLSTAVVLEVVNDIAICKVEVKKKSKPLPIVGRWG